jgi:hypothetical protein
MDYLLSAAGICGVVSAGDGSPKGPQLLCQLFRIQQKSRIPSGPLSLTTRNHHVEWIKGLFVKSRRFAFLTLQGQGFGIYADRVWGRVRASFYEGIDHVGPVEKKEREHCHQ